MGANTDHDRHRGVRSRVAARRALRTAFLISFAFLIIEAIGGLAAGSLALLADAGHMLTDVSSLGLALLANWLSSKPISPRRSYGWHRMEILAAFLNGLALIVLSLFIGIEAAHRFQSPTPVKGGLMLVVAVAGLAANLVSGAILFRAREENLNVKAAFMHVAADTLGSVGALVAAVLISTRGWMLADPIISIVISLLVLISSWTLIKESASILLQCAPSDLDSGAVAEDILAVPSIAQTHDLHIWTMTSGYVVLTTHVVLAEDADGDEVLHTLNEMLEQKWDIHHTTVQIERVSREHKEHR